MNKSAKLSVLSVIYERKKMTLLIKNGECILDSSHSDISAEEIAETIKV